MAELVDICDELEEINKDAKFIPEKDRKKDNVDIALLVAGGAFSKANPGFGLNDSYSVSDEDKHLFAPTDAADNALMSGFNDNDKK